MLQVFMRARLGRTTNRYSEVLVNDSEVENTDSEMINSCFCFDVFFFLICRWIAKKHQLKVSVDV